MKSIWTMTVLASICLVATGVEVRATDETVKDGPASVSAEEAIEQLRRACFEESPDKLVRKLPALEKLSAIVKKDEKGAAEAIAQALRPYLNKQEYSGSAANEAELLERIQEAIFIDCLMQSFLQSRLFVKYAEDCLKERDTNAEFMVKLLTRLGTATIVKVDNNIAVEDKQRIVEVMRSAAMSDRERVRLAGLRILTGCGLYERMLTGLAPEVAVPILEEYAQDPSILWVDRLPYMSQLIALGASSKSSLVNQVRQVVHDEKASKEDRIQGGRFLVGWDELSEGAYMSICKELGVGWNSAEPAE